MEIYLDNAATTPLMREAETAMRHFFSMNYQNPSAGYSSARNIRERIENARETLAKLIGANQEEIYFTSGGSESDNWAIYQATRAGKHIISTPIEHKAILKPLAEYESVGGKVSYLPVDSEGFVKEMDVRRAMTQRTGLISVMMANNEIGTIEPIEKIGKVAKEFDVLLHTDAVQAFTHMPIDVSQMQVDMLSASAHKFGGPKGIGFMYIRKDAKISPLIRGGAQERSMRAGTENVPGIIGMVTAAEISCKNLHKNISYCKQMCEYMTNRIINEIPDVIINGPADYDRRLCNNMNLGFAGIDATSLLALLDIYKISASAGSACNTEEKTFSHVLSAIGCDEKYIGGSLRMSIDSKITLQMADYVINILKKLVSDLRAK